VSSEPIVPVDVAHAWGWRAEAIAPLRGGLINQTYVVTADGAPIAVLQRLHTVFAAEVNLDLDAVTTHVAARGLETPRLIKTQSGQGWVVHDDRVWRALTWIDGETVAAVPDPDWAEAGGALVGRFHRAVADLAYDYRFTRTGVHDTAAHLAKLTERVRVARDREARGQSTPDEIEAQVLGREILAAAAELPELPVTPRRHVHGDLKISNLIFRRRPLRGASLVDLDTLGYGSMAFELGDAMRSWCNPRGEDAGSVHFELPVFAAALRGFRAVADAIVTHDERRSVAIGLETVCIELAARFAVDAFDDTYFGWDPGRFPSRRAHNLVRARGQLALGRDVRAARADVMDVVLAGG
jgi:Ser/Thr protein kinase RdoA (MazF antagonist)